MEKIPDTAGFRKPANHSMLPAMAFQPLSAVKVEDAFWSPRYALWRMTTIPDVLGKLESRSHVAQNLELAARGATSGHQGHYFFDGLLCEALRGASDYLAAQPDAALEGAIDRWAALIAAAQRPDGYLNTRCQIEGDNHRWGDNGAFGMDQHEIYDAGCLVEAGVHYYLATGKAALLGCAIRFANLLCDTMGPPPRRNLIPTHSLAEEALVKLARLLKDDPGAARKAGVAGRPDDYLSLVGFWLECHGRHCGEPDWSALGWGVRERIREMTATPHDPQWRPCWGDYQMDRVPLGEYGSIEGHAVRATLLCLGMATYARDSGDARWLGLAERFWASMVGRKMFVSGGVGAEPTFEAFAPDFALPPDAYLETCAAIGGAFFSARMAEIFGDGKYMDEVERVAYNALLTAVGADGRTYTYQNPLNTSDGRRWEWHGTPCCPPMFLKFTGALPGLIYARCADGFAVNLFVGGETSFDGGAAGRIRLVQTTDYPEGGNVEIEVKSERPASFALRIRIPGWARGIENPYGLYVSDGLRRWSMTLNGVAAEPSVENGYAIIEREWAPGDKVGLAFDVSERTVRARPEVRDVAGLVALMRGPVLMARENGRTIPYYDVANDGPAPREVWTAARE
ncbi:MAG: glycoside hydrolase family 127 protein [Kiritimatiellae bacterium]|nr:glycoside hydrolase family 127 protein [Kiritimatiellia bacterium]